LAIATDGRPDLIAVLKKLERLSPTPQPASNAGPWSGPFEHLPTGVLRELDVLGRFWARP
jgi:hypothetical protein